MTENKGFQPTTGKNQLPSWPCMHVFASSRKSVNYAAFAVDGDDSDGDFADPTPPAKKLKKEKVKPEKKVEKKSKEKSKRDSSSKNNKKNERKPLDDKLFDRDLELALQLSKQDSQNSQSEKEEEVAYMGKKQKEVAVLVHSTDSRQDAVDPPQPNPLRPESNVPNTDHDNKENKSDEDNKATLNTKTQKSSPKINYIQDDPIMLIETLGGSDAETGARRKRKAASVAVAKQREMISDGAEEGADDDDDDEFKADDPANDFGMSDSDDDYDAGDADSDFEGGFGRSKKKTKKGKSPRTSAAKKSPKSRGGKKEGTTSKSKPRGKTASKPISSKPSTVISSPATPLARHPQPKGPIRGFTPPTMSKGITGDKKSQQSVISSSQSTARKPSFCSPPSSSVNNPLGGVKLVSPSQPLRLGLSRYARVRPLHSNVKSP